MKKYSLMILFFLAITVIYAQNAESPVSRMDTAIKVLAGEIHKKLIEEKAQKIAIGQFTYRDSVPPLSAYWVNQLTEELTNMSGGSYTLLSGGPAGAERTISGEIVEAADVIRVYTRLIRSQDRAIAAGFHSDFERNEHISGMLSTGGSSQSSSSSVSMDAWEPDSWENPVRYEIGADESIAVINRTIHSRSDEDFFLLLPEADGRLVAETTGSIDTYMYLYNADTRELLAENDDGGSSYNARIRYNVRAGSPYIAKVKALDGETGQYGFRAYLQVQAQIAPDEYEPDDESSSAKLIEIGTPQQHTFHTGNDVDWVKFQITQPGPYTIRARGVNSNRLDTYIELFNADMNLIAEDDDGGDGYDARLSLRLDNGLYYLKVECLDDEPDQPYTISIQAE
ncbi:MAG: DVUA0089 family protein [Treponema sp.]|nr:DVUA0089 family protein [Treponema sp.]